MSAVLVRELDLAGVTRLAELVAFEARPGDLVALNGALGAGKTTFARAFIRAILADPQAEVPSPTFSLVQRYDTPRMPVVHADLYRLSGGEDLREIGLFDEEPSGVVLVEWPERAPSDIPAERIEVSFAELPRPDLRRIMLSATGDARARMDRVAAILDFLDRQPEWCSASVRYMQGDASTRAYARLYGKKRTAVLMDSPRQPDGPVVRDGKSYSMIAHLAEDVRPFVAVGLALSRAGFSAPDIFAHDLDRGLLLLEDLGDRVFGIEMRQGTPQEVLWREAVDVLIALRRNPLPRELPLPDGTTHRLPRFDRAALELEIELLLDWYWPAVIGSPPPDSVRAGFLALWRPLLDRLMALPPGIFLRDFHSPNLMWLPERTGIEKVGLLDFQDALAEPWAYDLVSLLHDARVDVPESLERDLYGRYCSEVAASEPRFDPAEFAFAYSAFGAQRRTRHIGLFVRLLRRDGKAGYLQHIPRAWEHLDRCLAHPHLAEIRSWLDRHIPQPVRRRAISA